jgi:small subunit ribosomal protein S8
MSMTDPIADLLTRLRNGTQGRKEYVDCPWSGIKERLVQVLVGEGFAVEYSVIKRGAGQDLRVWLRYDEKNRPAISGIKRISKPSLRRYVGVKSVPRVRRGLGINILSTPEGIMADREAIRRNVGGELLCSVW